MKTLLIMIALIGLCYTTQAQSNRGIRHSGSGTAMMIGGVSLTIGAFTTRPEKYYTGNGGWAIKPFHRQGPRASAIVCGLSLTITGLITSIINNPPKRKR